MLHRKRVTADRGTHIERLGDANPINRILTHHRSAFFDSLTEFPFAKSPTKALIHAQEQGDGFMFKLRGETFRYARLDIDEAQRLQVIRKALTNEQTMRAGHLFNVTGDEAYKRPYSVRIIGEWAAKQSFEVPELTGYLDTFAQIQTADVLCMLAKSEQPAPEIDIEHFLATTAVAGRHLRSV